MYVYVSGIISRTAGSIFIKKISEGGDKRERERERVRERERGEREGAREEKRGRER